MPYTLYLIFHEDSLKIDILYNCYLSCCHQKYIKSVHILATKSYNQEDSCERVNQVSIILVSGSKEAQLLV